MSDARLENLVRRIMKEKDPVEFDKLCSELWRFSTNVTVSQA